MKTMLTFTSLVLVGILATAPARAQQTTVNGPVPSSMVTRSAAVSALASVVNDPAPTTVSMMFLQGDPTDLDGLAGTGLESINDESRRWSMPIGGITGRF